MKARGQLDYYLDGHVKNSPSFSFGWKLVARRSARRKIIAAQLSGDADRARRGGQHYPKVQLFGQLILLRCTSILFLPSSIRVGNSLLMIQHPAAYFILSGSSLITSLQHRLNNIGHDTIDPR